MFVDTEPDLLQHGGDVCDSNTSVDAAGSSTTPNRKKQDNFFELDRLPVGQKAKSLWNKRLGENPDLWEKKCHSWSSDLMLIFQHAEVCRWFLYCTCETPALTAFSAVFEFCFDFDQQNENLEDQNIWCYGTVVDVLRQMRLVEPVIYRTSQWRAVVQVRNNNSQGLLSFLIDMIIIFTSLQVWRLLLIPGPIPQGW